VHPRAKNYLIILLAFSTATAGTLAWRQAQKIRQLQASLIATSAAPAPHKPAVHWSDAVTATKAKTTAEPDEPADDTADNAQPARQRRNNRPNFTALMANPAFAKAWNTEQRARIDARYAALFKKLNLSPEQQTALANLLLERQNSARDVFAAAREQGLNPGQNRDDLRKMVTDAQAEVDQNIKTTLGDTAYQQYQNYENTQSQRAIVSQLNQTLSALATPLTTAQSDFLVQALSTPAATAQSSAQGGGPWGRGGTTITDAVIEQAQNVLSPAQVDALRQLQTQQQAQQTIRQMMRGGGGRGGNPPPGN